jgi:hypothetical protein
MFGKGFLVPKNTVSSPVNAMHTMVYYWSVLGYEDIDWVDSGLRRWHFRDTESPVKSSSSAAAPAKSLLFVLLLVVIRFPSILNHAIELSA